MTDAELLRVIVAELHKVAPEVDLSAIGPDQLLRDALDVDSFDFLNVLVGLHAALGVEVPEADYGQLGTLNGMVRYFGARV